MLSNTAVSWPGYSTLPPWVIMISCRLEMEREKLFSVPPPHPVVCLAASPHSRPTVHSSLPPDIEKKIQGRSAGAGCKRLVSANCQIKRSERMIRPTFSRISSKLAPSMFGSTLWHPGERNTSDTQTRHEGQTKTRLICVVLPSGQAASRSRPACGRTALKEGLAILPLEKEAKHLGVLTMA